MFENEIDKIDFTVDTDNLYREENFTDLNLASVKRMIPVNKDGSEDKSRPVLFLGHTQMMTPAGSIPIQCPLDAQNFAEAIAVFPKTMKEALHLVIEELKKQESESSRIIMPDGQSDGKILF
ncbi:MAG: cytoplasmic protein [Desulfococcaceae bacterium]|jgi:hypothetical protein|nr:cytoplasmic protein [Desulfococcaceae bacterium]